MKLTRKNATQPKRLWTCSAATRKFLEEHPGDEPLEGVLLLHPRIADSITKAKDSADGSRVRTYRITTESVDRHGDVVRSRGIQLKNFRKNPVVLFAHQSYSPPVGTAKRVEPGDGYIDSDVDFFDRETYDFADTVFRIVDLGGMKAASIGFMPVKYERIENDEGNMTGVDFVKSDLLEWSIVPVPANPEAVSRAFSDGAPMKQYSDWLEDVQDNWDESAPVMEDLGIKRELIEATYKAANGSRVLVPARIADERDELDEALEDGESKAADPQPVTIREERFDDARMTFVVGEFPAELLLAKCLLDSADQSMLRKDGDKLCVTFDDTSAVYSIESETDQTIVGKLLEVKQLGPVSYDAVHAKGVSAQPRDAAWDGAKELRSAQADELPAMCAWKDPGAETYRLPHHTAGAKSALNFRGLASAVALLFGARGGAGIPDAGKKGAFAHIARHLRDDFDAMPPEPRWLAVEPLKNHPKCFHFDYRSSTLLAKIADGYVDARTVQISKEGVIEFREGFRAPAVTVDTEVVRAIRGRRSAWKSMEEFVGWAKDAGYKTDNVRETRTFWHLPQLDDDTDAHEVRTLSILPNDAEAQSEDCRVQAELVPSKSEQPEQKQHFRAVSTDPHFEVGDVVKLPSGGKSMTVEQEWADGKVTCSWFDDAGSLHRDDFLVQSLGFKDDFEDGPGDSDALKAEGGDDFDDDGEELEMDDPLELLDGLDESDKQFLKSGLQEHAAGLVKESVGASVKAALRSVKGEVE